MARFGISNLIFMNLTNGERLEDKKDECNGA